MKIFARSKKKAALSLSMEAIVILIIAVVMLGLGLGFVRGLFTKMGDQSNKALTLSELLDPPSEDKPVTLTPSEITIKEKGDEQRVQVAFYNPSPTKTKWEVSVSPSSLSAAQKTAIDQKLLIYSYFDGSFLLQKGKITGYNIVFSAKDTLIKTGLGGTYATEDSAVILYSVTVCSVLSTTLPPAKVICEPNGEVYQKEIVLRVRS